MDFTDQIGRKLVLSVRKWTDPRGQERLGFSGKANDFDEMLFKARTPSQRLRDERQMEREQWDLIPTDFSRGRADPYYGSLHIYSLSAEAPEPLVEGDAWEAEVTSCTYDPGAPPTKDGRQKVRYSVRPLRRVVSTYVHGSFDQSCIFRETRCGSNNVAVRIECRIAAARYQANGHVIEVDQLVAKKPEPFYRLRQVQPKRAIVDDKRRALGRAATATGLIKVQRDLDALPQAPEDLVRGIPRWRFMH